MQGQRDLTTTASAYNAQDFMIRRLQASINTAEPVRVLAVDGQGTEPVGFVDVLPLVNLVSGDRQGQRQSALYHLPYLRIQGGKNALLIDPQPGDVGLAVYAMRDTETVKDTRGSAPANPGSERSLSKSDGFYLGGMLNGSPERYIQVDDTGVTVEGVAKIDMHGQTATITAENGCTIHADVTINGNVLINGSITWTGTAQGQGGAARFAGGLTNAGGQVDSNGIVLDSHVHSGVEPGPGTTGGPL